MKLFLLLVFLFVTYLAPAQRYPDSIRKVLQNEKEDSTKILTLDALAVYFTYAQQDSCFDYSDRVAALSEKLNYPYGQFLAGRSRFFATNLRGNYPGALAIAISNMGIAEKLKVNRLRGLILSHQDIGLVSREMGDLARDKLETEESLRLFYQLGQVNGDLAGPFLGMALVHLRANALDSALYYVQKGVELASHATSFLPYLALYKAVLGNVYERMGNFSLARSKYVEGLGLCEIYNNIYIRARIYNNMARLYRRTNLPDSSLYYAGMSLQLCVQHNFGDYLADAASLLAQTYESKGRPDSSLKYVRIMMAAKDTVFSRERMQRFQSLMADEEQRKREIALAKEKYRVQLVTYVLLAVLVFFLVVAFILYRNNRQKQKANALLQSQKIEIEKQRAKAETALQDLQSTQAQLIQSEKMASLGELTAGIAHEIQNPLNFVNNFSEVNLELIAELKEGKKKLNGDPETEIGLLNDIQQNEEKINHHGKRADAIVKGMLQHSSMNPGSKEPTDINALADEFLRISYHGLRAKDKKFNAAIVTHFDERLENVNIVPQDMGRALINLYNNAFYAVHEKRQGAPTVTVTTKKIGDKVEIRIGDNGIGIPQKILDKIYQPFFTTKPTGQGTGLGLSLAYDIISKEHSGTIRVETKEGEYTEFIIQLPLQ